MTSYRNGWDDDRVAALRRLWADGLSASQIADELGGGITRNGVIGKVHRLKLSGRARPSKKVKVLKEPKPAKPKPNSVSQFFRKSKNTKPLPEPEPDFPLAPIGPRISITELRDETCRWPVGDISAEDFGYCGSAGAKLSEGKPYCPYHARISRQPVTAMRERKRSYAQRSEQASRFNPAWS